MSPPGELHPAANSIACSLERAEMAKRGQRWERLADRALIAASRSGERSAVQRYRAEPGVESELQELIRLEGDCCPFLDFDLTRRGGEIALEIRGPEGASELVAGFAGERADSA